MERLDMKTRTGIILIFSLFLVLIFYGRSAINEEIESTTIPDSNYKLRQFKPDIQQGVPESFFSKTEGTLNDGTFYRLVETGSKPEIAKYGILLLHGAAFSSKTWEELGTIDALGESGEVHTVLAIDIPGFGNSKQLTKPDNPIEYLNSVLDQFPRLGSGFILVSPSMSGSLALPYLFSENESLIGFVAVAPVGASEYANQYANIKIPALIYYGEKDLGLGKRGAEFLSKIPNSKTVIVPNGKHPAYLDDPDLWHTTLLKFISTL